jgi:hypothetical protein
MEQWWNETNRADPKFWDKTLCHCHIVHHKSNMDWPGIEV